MTINRRTSRAGVAIALFVGVMMTATTVAAQNQTLSPTMVPLSPIEDASGALDLGVAVNGG